MKKYNPLILVLLFLVAVVTTFAMYEFTAMDVDNQKITANKTSQVQSNVSHETSQHKVKSEDSESDMSTSMSSANDSDSMESSSSSMISSEVNDEAADLAGEMLNNIQKDITENPVSYDWDDIAINGENNQFVNKVKQNIQDFVDSEAAESSYTINSSAQNVEMSSDGKVNVDIKVKLDVDGEEFTHDYQTSFSVIEDDDKLLIDNQQ